MKPHPASMLAAKLDPRVLGAWDISSYAPVQDTQLVVEQALPLQSASSLEAVWLSGAAYSGHGSPAPPSPHSSALPTARLPCTAAKLMRLLKHQTLRVAKPALRCVGNIVCSEDDRKDFTEAIVELGAVQLLCTLMEHPAREMVKEARLMISLTHCSNCLD
jgi:hypothetical protein